MNLLRSLENASKEAEQEVLGEVERLIRGNAPGATMQPKQATNLMYKIQIETTDPGLPFLTDQKWVLNTPPFDFPGGIIGSFLAGQLIGELINATVTLRPGLRCLVA